MGEASDEVEEGVEDLRLEEARFAGNPPQPPFIKGGRRKDRLHVVKDDDRRLVVKRPLYKLPRALLALSRLGD